MAEMNALRARLKDRQVKEGALGTTEVSLCLDMALIAELAELEEQQGQWSLDHPTPSSSGSLAGKPKPTTNPLDKQVEAKRAEIASASIIVVFRAISSQRYQDLVNQFEDPDGDQRIEWLDALVALCFFEVWSEGEKVALEWSEIKPELAFGEEDDVRTRVFNLNRRKQDIPFSSRPSRTLRKPAA